MTDVKGARTLTLEGALEVLNARWLGLVGDCRGSASRYARLITAFQMKKINCSSDEGPRNRVMLAHGRQVPYEGLYESILVA